MIFNKDINKRTNSSILTLIEGNKQTIYKIHKQTTLKEFASSINACEEDCLLEDNDLKKGHYVVVKPKDYFVYIVRPNQTLTDIAKIFNIKEEKIILENNIKTLFAGQQLIIKK